MPALLRVLFVGFAWLPIAFALYAAKAPGTRPRGEFVLGRAPAHALFIGFFGSLLVAMVTRVTQGHSGRPLVLGRVAGFAFVVDPGRRGAARARGIRARCAAPGRPIAGCGWLLAFLPWVAAFGLDLSDAAR